MTSLFEDENRTGDYEFLVEFRTKNMKNPIKYRYSTTTKKATWRERSYRDLFLCINNVLI